MKPLDSLPLLILATLHGKDSAVSRYEVMAQVNEVAQVIDRPYSPGAVYHSIKQLTTRELIEFNHEQIKISPSGKEALREVLLVGQAPHSLSGLLCRILSIQLAGDPELSKGGSHRLSIEMIKNNQIPKKSDHLTGSQEKALNICRNKLSIALSQIVLELGA